MSFNPAEEKSTTSRLWNQLSIANSLRSGEDQVLWTIAGIFWAANAILLVALFQDGDIPATKAPGVVISAAGMLFSILQYFLQGRALGHIRRYEELIRRIEKDGLGLAPRYCVSYELNSVDADKYLGGDKGKIKKMLIMGTLFRVRNLMQISSGSLAVVWFGALIFFIFKS
ncbi:hypothetical protein ACFLU1_02145 [Chloroflexota bacterium]